MGRTCGGAIIGRDEIDDVVAIQRMVDLLEDDPTLGIRRAAAVAAQSIKGTPATHVERLRRKYRKLKRSNLLPEGGEAAKIERQSREIREAYGRHKESVQAAKLELIEAEKEAAAVGIELAGLDSMVSLMNLNREKENLDSLLSNPAGHNMSLFLSHGVDNPEEAIERLKSAYARREVVKRQIEALRKVRQLRNIASMPG